MVRRAAVFVAVLGGATGALLMLDTVPTSLERAPPRFFSTLSEAEIAVGARFTLPAYFPDHLEWPPSVIEARAVPLQVAIDVHDRGTGDLVLVLREWEGEEPHFRPAMDLRPTGQGPQWELGLDRSGREWRRARVRDQERQVELTARLPDRELRRMLDSLGRE